MLDEMLSSKGDTAVYLLYSYIRLCSILRNSGFSEEEIKSGEFKFTDDYEKVLASHIVGFSEMIDYVSSKKLALNFICNYLFILA
jgi:arginyl-tRNA synthetase